MVSHEIRGQRPGALFADRWFNSDYINPIDLCNRLNTYIIPEAAVHAFLTFLFLINGYWLALLLNLPLLAFNAKKCVPSCTKKHTWADKITLAGSLTTNISLMRPRFSGN